jgi:hypothetical protein
MGTPQSSGMEIDQREKACHCQPKRIATDDLASAVSHCFVDMQDFCGMEALCCGIRQREYYRGKTQCKVALMIP